MLSRRNIRIKLLQVLFARALNPDDTAEIRKQYRQRVQLSYKLLIYCLYALVEIAHKSIEDKEHRENKHLPKAEDEAFTARLYHNPIIESLSKNVGFIKLCKKYEFDKVTDPDLLQRIYKSYRKQEEYIAYATNADGGPSDIEALLTFFREIRKNEIFEDLMYDYGHSWWDDKSLIVGAVKKVLKQLPDETDFLMLYRPDDETVEDFGMRLLEGTQEREEELTSYIQPVLDNWDMERLAVMDVIVLKMAVCEMILFEKIPVKASINEYLEIVKTYSTDKSKDFVNGILDTLMKSLTKDGTIQKSA